MKKVITIGRQCGSGGHTVGKLVAERLGVPFYDKEIIKAVAKRSGISQEAIEQKGGIFHAELLVYCRHTWYQCIQYVKP